MLRLERVGKQYGGRPVLVDVELELPFGAAVGLLGGNGSGKSTLLRILAGITRQTTGRVRGRPRRIGYVPEKFPSRQRLSAVGYLTHLGRINGLSGRRARDRAEELLARLALSGDPRTPLRLLSKGNAQKVALAQALLRPPRLLVLDEPWSGLDAATHAVLGDLIAEAREAGAAVVFTDHRAAVVAEHATVRYRLAEGRLLAGEPPTGPHSVTEPSTVDAARVELRYRDGTPNRHAAFPWSTVDGVRGATPTVDGYLVHIDRATSDDLLRAALRTGWSVHALTPAPATAPAPEPPPAAEVTPAAPGTAASDTPAQATPAADPISPTEPHSPPPAAPQPTADPTADPATAPTSATPEPTPIAAATDADPTDADPTGESTSDPAVTTRSGR